MHRLLIAIAAASLAPIASADDMTPRATIDALFDAMLEGDGDAVLDQVMAGAPLARVEADGNVRDSSFTDWASWVDLQEPGYADEQIFAVESRAFGDLATVWAPFTLVYKGELVGCGINQFTLARAGDTWKIIHGIDTQDDGDCTTFEARYTAALTGRTTE